MQTSFYARYPYIIYDNFIKIIFIEFRYLSKLQMSEYKTLPIRLVINFCYTMRL